MRRARNLWISVADDLGAPIDPSDAPELDWIDRHRLGRTGGPINPDNGGGSDSLHLSFQLGDHLEQRRPQLYTGNDQTGVLTVGRDW